MTNAQTTRQTRCVLAISMASFIFATNSLIAKTPKPTKPATQPTSKPATSQPAINPNNLPKELFLDFGNNIGMKLVLIPAGKFLMGSPEDEKGRSGNEGPQHEVTFQKPFYMSSYKVTVFHWQEVMRKDGAIVIKQGKMNATDGQGPPGGPFWKDCQAFCKKISAKIGYKVRLPSEAEWEYACRAGSKTRYYYGDDLDYTELSDYAWWKKNWDTQLKHMVGQKKPNAWGLYDMHGLKWEWCEDHYHSDYDGAPTDGSAWVDQDNRPFWPWQEDNSLRVIRGGNPDCRLPSELRCAKRDSLVPNYYMGIGFRMVLELKDNP